MFALKILGGPSTVFVVCASESRRISNMCKNLSGQHHLQAEIYNVSQNSALRFCDIFPKRMGIFNHFYTRIITFLLQKPAIFCSIISNMDEVMPY